MNNNLKNSCKDKSFLSDLRFLPSNLRIKAFEKKRVKQILNAAMERAPYTAMLMMDIYVQFMIMCHLQLVLPKVIAIGMLYLHFFYLGASTGHCER